jgi:hypothetical protein
MQADVPRSTDVSGDLLPPSPPATAAATQLWLSRQFPHRVHFLDNRNQKYWLLSRGNGLGRAGAS